MNRRTFLKAAGIAGCTGGPTGDGSEATASTDSTNGSTDKTNVAVVYATGGLGNGSFNDQAQDGLQRAKQKLNVASEHSQPSNVSDFSQVQRQYAQSTSPTFDLICCIGALQKDALAETAPQFPKQKFMLVDQKVDANNVESYQFREEQGSFQIGHLAGLLTKMEFSAGKASTNGAPKVGFIAVKRYPSSRSSRRDTKPASSTRAGTSASTPTTCDRSTTSLVEKKPHSPSTTMVSTSYTTLRGTPEPAFSKPHRKSIGTLSASIATSRRRNPTTPTSSPQAW